MNILVTGASGFLGPALCKTLKEQNHNVVGLSSKDADLTNQNSLLPFNDKKYDKIFHLAHWAQAGDFCFYHSGEQWLINHQINTTVLTWWSKHQPQAKLISFGSSCSYEEGRDLVESNYLEGTPREELYFYAMTKRMLLMGQQALNKQYGLKYLTVVPSTFYGPGYHITDKQSHFIFDLVRKILNFKHRGEDIILWGDGKQRRELVYIDDFVSALLQLDELVENDIVNIPEGKDYTIHEFASMICEIVGVDASNIKYDTSKYVGAKAKNLSTAKIDALLPNRQRTSLHEGLSKTIAYMEKALFG